MIKSFTKKEIEEMIDQYVEGQLSEDEVDELWVELVRDGYHLEYLKTTANLKEVIKKEQRNDRVIRIRRYWSYAAAAMIALTIGVLLVLNFYQSDTIAHIQPIENIELEYYRSSEGPAVNEEDDRIIQEAIRLANTGEFDRAVSLIKKELEKTEDEPRRISELYLTLGSLHYNEDHYEQAAAYFKEVLDRKNSVDVLMLEKAYWYIGNAYFQLDNLDKAKQNIRKAYELNGAYRRVAKSYLNALAAR